MTSEDTRSLVQRARAGDRQAFDALAGRYREHLEALIRQRLGEGLRGRVAVEDIHQETLLRALRSLAHFEWREAEHDASFFRWLSGIAVRVILEAAASARRSAPIALDFEVMADEVSPSRTLARKERLERLQQAIAHLSPDYQTVLRLVRIEGLPVSEAAKRMRRTPNAVSQLLLRALRKLRERFGETESLGLPAEEPLGDGTGAGEIER
jgi:RNA polymerase sigma-70 factor (ECF subfamily)